MNIWGILQILLTAFETGLCIWTCDMVVYDGELVKEHKKNIVGYVLIITSIVICNRKDIFFSWLLFFIQIFSVWSVYLIKKFRNRVMCVLFLLDYYLLTTLLDLTFSFLAASYLNESFWDEIYCQVSGGRILIYLISRSIMFGVCIIIEFYKKKLQFSVEDYKGILFSTGVIGCVWGWWLLMTLIDHGNNTGLGDSFFIVTCLVILSILMVIELRDTHLKTQSQMILMKNELLEENYNNLRNLYKNNQYIYHDFKHHIVILRNYLEKEEYEKARLYMDQIAEPVERLNNYVSSGCDVLDLVLNIKEYEANQKGIKYKVDIDREVKFRVNDNELGNIFFNLLDNAIEACEKIQNREKWIHVTIKKKNQIHIIKVENSIEKQIFMKDGEYVTEKDNKELHGLGMKSVEVSVNRYRGNVKWSHTKDIFTVVITFFENEL